MKSTVFSVLAMSLFTSSVWADSQKEPNAVTFTGISGDLTCKTEFTIDGYFYANSTTEDYTYGIWFGEQPGSTDAILAYKIYSPSNNNDKPVSTVSDFFGSDKDAYKASFHFEGTLESMSMGLYDSSSGKILFENSKKNYYVYAFVAPGNVESYSDGHFHDNAIVINNEDVYTSIGGSFPPTDASKFITFDYGSCTDSELPTSVDMNSVTATTNA